MLRLGTKCPSITSMWMRPAPPRSQSRTCSPSRAKSADNMDGAITIMSNSLSPAMHIHFTNSQDLMVLGEQDCLGHDEECGPQNLTGSAGVVGQSRRESTLPAQI